MKFELIAECHSTHLKYDRGSIGANISYEQLYKGGCYYNMPLYKGYQAYVCINLLFWSITLGLMWYKIVKEVDKVD